MKFTVLGANGFIGSAFVQYLTSKGHEVIAVSRDTKIERDFSLGHVIYAIGLTGNFREKLFETVDAHVTTLAHWLQHYRFDSFLYLSSTRIFEGAPDSTPVNEQSLITLLPNSNTIYDLSKLMGEALCMAHPFQTVRVVRLSNVYGRNQSVHNFLGSVMHSLFNSKEVVIREACESVKDYVSLEDVIPLLFAIATTGRERIYHLASGLSISHRTLADALRIKGNYKISFLPGAFNRKFPVIDISRIRAEFDFVPQNILDNLDQLIMH